MKWSFVPSFRYITLAPMNAAPWSAIALMVASSFEGWVVKPGTTGAISTPALTPASRSWRTARSRCSGWRRARLERAPRFFVHRRHAHVDRAAVPPTDVSKQIGIAHDHRPLGDQADGRPSGEQRLERTSRELVMTLDGLIRIGRGADGYLLANPRGFVELSAQHVDQVDLHEDDAREVIARSELELRLIPSGEAVVATVCAAPIRVQRPVEGHAFDAVQGRLAGDFLVARRIGPPLGFVQRRFTSLTNL